MKQPNARLRITGGFGAPGFVGKTKNHELCSAANYFAQRCASAEPRLHFMSIRTLLSTTRLLPPRWKAIESLRSRPQLIPRTIALFDEQSRPRLMWYALGRSLHGSAACVSTP
mmetsp:Transcript_324/g.2594  ORF Transcript_324/g.2594 Transcript_324/m.2594 type:complete len:113 (+) Transcript_324:3481-3819(+)